MSALPKTPTVGSRSGHSTNIIAKGRVDEPQNGHSIVGEPLPMPLVNTFGLQNSKRTSGNSKDQAIFHQTFETAIQGFTESAQIGVNVLTEIAKIHPFIAAPVLAFKLVVILDLKRRENNAKVLAVKVQMQSTMAVLFQLRNVKDSNEVGLDGITIAGRLQTTMLEMADYIKEVASGCDLYTKKSLIRKYLKSFIYEARLAEYVRRLAEYQTELEQALSIHTTKGVDSANEKLDIQGARLVDIQTQIQELFLRLDTPREKEIREIIKSNGGPKASVVNEQVLQVLVDKSGEDISGFGRDRLKKNSSDMRNSLLNELAEDVDKAFRLNLELFDGKLDIQKRELDDSITRQGDRIIAFFSGGHERIMDPQLREIWKEMGWKSTVKARHFVLALRDYYLRDQTTHRRQYYKGSTLVNQQLLSPPMTTSPSEQSDYEFPDPQLDTVNDEWATAYVNVSYLQAISEAIDDDGSGFINIKEINDFTCSRPKNWSVLQWLAYWAAGWHSSISIYLSKIYRLLRKMYKLRDKVRPDNRRMLDGFLDNKAALYRLELFLRSLKTVEDEETLITQDLAKLRDEFSSAEERRIEENLEKISYNIDSSATVSLLTGPGRIERYIYPLIYLLLKHQIKIVHLARGNVLHLNEFESGCESLAFVFNAFQTRIQDLSAIFQQMHINPEEYFANFAFGMFKTLHGDIEWSIARYKLSSAWDNLPLEEGEDEDVDTCPDNISLDILKYGVQEPLSFPTTAPTPLTAQPDDGPDILSGNWAGYCLREEDGESVPHEGLFRLFFDLGANDDGSISGSANGYIGALEMSSRLHSTDDGIHKVDLVMVYEDGYWLRCKGTLDTSSATIKGDWYSRDYVSEPKPNPGGEIDDRSDGTFQFSRVPAPLVRFRYAQATFSENKAKARWSFACAAVLYEVQRDRFAKDYVISRLRDGRRFKELAVKRMIENFGNTRRTEFTQEERLEMRKLEYTMCPTVDQFYYSIARFVYQRLTHHPGISCDGLDCGREILQSRLLCIVCLGQDLIDSLDFCINCKDVALPNHATHTTSHSLIRGNRLMHDCERAWMIPKARAMSDRLKTAFRARAAAPSGEVVNLVDKNAHEHAQDEAEDSMTCVFCQKEVSLPCWVCLECSVDAFVCDDCDKERQLPPLPEKIVTTPASMIHAMLRIKDDKPVEIPDSDQLARVEKRITGVKVNVEERLENLEKQLMSRTSMLEGLLTDRAPSPNSKGELELRFSNVEHRMEEHMAALGGKFEERLSSIETRFSSLEQLLKVFLAKVSV